MSAIARAENRTCDPNMHNMSVGETHRRADGSTICVGSYGVLQVGCLHYKQGDDRNDLATNVRIAYRVYESRKMWDSSGYRAWTQYNNGEYKKYL